MKIAPSFADRLLHRELVALAAFFLVSGAGVLGQEPPELSEKISPMIELHRKLKEKKPTPEQARAEAQAEGLAPDSIGYFDLNLSPVDRAEVAIYFAERPDAAEIAEFEAEGIEIKRHLWIPPVPGKHPQGYHLAEVPYDRLNLLDTDNRIVRVESAESQMRPHNDTGSALIGSTAFKAEGFDGTGVTIAIADSGCDLSHADLAGNPPVEAWDLTDGEAAPDPVGDPMNLIPDWDSDVSNLVENHGTHVSGSVLGDGNLSGGQYAGPATGADWAFYKIGNDTTAGASFTDMIEAIQRTQTQGYDIFSMSYGGFSDFMDGSNSVEQAIDAAVAAGVTVFISAGNEAEDRQHDSVVVAAGTTSAGFGFSVTANGTANPVRHIRVIWSDNATNDGNITLACSNLGGGESLTPFSPSISSRGTEGRSYLLNTVLGAGTSKSYNLTLTNSATSGPAPRVHCYSFSANNLSATSTFDSPDESYTVSTPALADGALAVAAWVHRGFWMACDGNFYSFTGETQGTRATFSSRGPRIDGTRKPEIAAPGSAMISLLDGGHGSFPSAIQAPLIVDNDGVTGGACNYAVSQGTSMACPIAAGAAAQILQANPGYSPADIRNFLTTNASQAQSPDDDIGWGLINVLGGTWVDFNFSGSENGTFNNPFNTLAEGVSAAPVGGRIRMKPGSSSETITINKELTIEAFNGTVTIGN